MAGVNKVILVGNLGKDPETKSFANGGSVTRFTLATSETWRDKQSGERKEKTEWHNVSIFNENLGKIAGQYLRKGSKVYIEGAIQTRKWADQSGVEKFSTEIELQKFRGELTMLDGRSGDAEQGEGGGYSSGSSGFSSGPRQTSTAPREDFSANLDDEIPF